MRSAGDIDGGDIVAVGPGLIRLDLTKFDSTAFQDAHRVTAVLDLHTARAMTIALINAINAAEVEQARSDKKGRRK